MDLLSRKKATKKKRQIVLCTCTSFTTIGSGSFFFSMFLRRVRFWACDRISKETVSSLAALTALIVSTWFLTPVVALGLNSNNNNNNLPVSSTLYNSGGGGGGYSNITLLDLYPELKEYLLKKALSQINSVPSTTTEDYANSYNYNGVGVGTSDNFNLAALQQQVQNLLQNSQSQNYQQNLWNYNDNSPGVNLNANLLNTNGAGGIGSAGGIIGQGQGGYLNSRGDLLDSDTADTYNYQKEVLKHFQPFGPPEFWDSWKFKPSPPPSVGWTSTYPIWEEPEPEYTHHHIGYEHEVSKDFSCLAGLLGLKTLKKLKISTILSKLKYIGIFAIAFKLGVLLSPIAIPLLFPIILLVTAVKILPLILIIVLLLKLLKKQIKIKKPFGKFLDRTGSLFFDDMDFVTEKVTNSDETVEKLSRDISNKPLEKRRRKGRVNSKKLDIDT